MGVKFMGGAPEGVNEAFIAKLELDAPLVLCGMLPRSITNQTVAFKELKAGCKHYPSSKLIIIPVIHEDGLAYAFKRALGASYFHPSKTMSSYNICKCTGMAFLMAIPSSQLFAASTSEVKAI